MKKSVWQLIIFCFFTNILTANHVTGNESKAEISGELKKWHKITLTFDGPETLEMDKLNPFMNYRFEHVGINGN